MSVERPENQTFQDLEKITPVLNARGEKTILHDTDGSVRDLFEINLAVDDSDKTLQVRIDPERKTLELAELGKPIADGRVIPKIATSTYGDYEGFEMLTGKNAVRFYGKDWSVTIERYWDTPGKLRFNSSGKAPTIETVPENIKLVYDLNLPKQPFPSQPK